MSKELKVRRDKTVESRDVVVILDTCMTVVGKP